MRGAWHYISTFATAVLAVIIIAFIVKNGKTPVDVDLVFSKISTSVLVLILGSMVLGVLLFGAARWTWRQWRRRKRPE